MRETQKIGGIYIKKVQVIDSIMGSGKTSWIIQRMNEQQFGVMQRFIYITPYLEEIARVKKAVTNPSRQLVEPNNQNGQGSKLKSLKNWVKGGYDIISTHALLQNADDELIELIQEHDYKLVIDEAINVIEDQPISETDMKRLISNEDIQIDKEGKVHWTGEDEDKLDTRFTDIYFLAKAGTLYYVRGSLLIKIFNENILKAFNQVTVMTYLFDYSQMSAWLEWNEIGYRKKSVQFNPEMGRYKLITYDIKNENRKGLYELMNIDKKYSEELSHINFTKRGLNTLVEENVTEYFNTISRVIRNFLRHYENGENKGYWTILKDIKRHIKPKSYNRRHISLNTRATNKYAEAPALAYLCDMHINPMHKGFFDDRKVSFNQDGWAVSELLQFIYRSRVRNGEEVALLLPSKRMRDILKEWSEGKL